ncbi:MAG: DUF4340 domain-containing protein [Ignavibacteria bacterium]|nr:DUF4340 domain-containing protein [Ignavibacteria bacterium]
MNKSIKILLGIFAILIAVYFLFFRSGEKVSTEKIDAKLFVADSSKIDKIEIVKTTETLVFEKSGNQWKITKPIQYAADTTAVNAMLKDLKNFMLESVASENPAKFSGYLDSVNNATIATYQEGKLLGTFILGKSQANDNSYIKNPNENRILLASKLTAANFTKTLKDYRDKFIVSMNTMGVNKIVFKSTDSNNVDFTAQKDSVNIWRIDGDSVSSSVMEGFLNMFNKFNTEDFKDTVMTTFPAPTYTVSFTGPAVQTVVNLYKENSEPPSFICQVSGVNQLFKFYASMASQIMKKKTDFVPAPPKK